MKNILLILALALSFSGCETIESMSTQERQTLYVVVGVVVGIAAISYADDDNSFQCHPHGKKHECH